MLSWRAAPSATTTIASYARGRRALIAEFGAGSAAVRSFHRLVFGADGHEVSPASIDVNLYFEQPDAPQLRRRRVRRSAGRTRLLARVQAELAARDGDELADILDARARPTLATDPVEDPLDDDLPADLAGDAPTPTLRTAPAAPAWRVDDVLDFQMSSLARARGARMRARLKLRRELERARSRAEGAERFARQLAQATMPGGTCIPRRPSDQHRVNRARNFAWQLRADTAAIEAQLAQLDREIADRAEAMRAARERLLPIVVEALAGASPRWRHKDGRLIDAKGRNIIPTDLDAWLGR